MGFVDRAHQLGGESLIGVCGGQGCDARYLARVKIDVLGHDGLYVFGFDQGGGRVYVDVAPAGCGARDVHSALASWVSHVALSGAFLRSLGVMLARFCTLPPSTPALLHSAFVYILLHCLRFPFSLAQFPSLICGSGSSGACLSIPPFAGVFCTLFPIFRSSFEVFCSGIFLEAS